MREEEREGRMAVLGWEGETKRKKAARKGGKRARER